LLRLALLLFCLALGLLGAAVGLYLRSRPPVPAFHRGFTPVTLDWTDANCWVPDAEVEHLLAPGADFTAVNDDGEPIRYQAAAIAPGGASFRDDGIQTPVFAVAVGDSFTFGHGVRLEECWVERLESSCRADVVNLGVSNIFGPTQYLRTLRRHGLPLRPKVVIWATFVNDWLDDTLFRCWTDATRVLGRQIEYPRSRPLYDAIRRVAYCQPDESPPFPPLDARVPYAADGLCFTFDATAYAVQDVGFAAIAAGRDSAADAVREARAAAEGAGAALVVVVIPAKEQVYHRQAAAVLGYARTQASAAFAAAVAADCAAQDILCLDLLPVLRERAARGEQLYFREDGHWNAAGHRVAAEAIEAFLGQTGRTRPDGPGGGGATPEE